MVNGQISDVGGRVVAPPLVHISVHMEVNRVMSHRLLAHVLQLYPRDMDGPETPFNLVTADTTESGSGPCLTRMKVFIWTWYVWEGKFTMESKQERRKNGRNDGERRLNYRSRRGERREGGRSRGEMGRRRRSLRRRSTTANDGQMTKLGLLQKAHQL